MSRIEDDHCCRLSVRQRLAVSALDHETLDAAAAAAAIACAAAARDVDWLHGEYALLRAQLVSRRHTGEPTSTENELLAALTDALFVRAATAHDCACLTLAEHVVTGLRALASEQATKN